LSSDVFTETKRGHPRSARGCPVGSVELLSGLGRMTKCQRKGVGKGFDDSFPACREWRVTKSEI
jgi:hypothetical protein